MPKGPRMKKEEIDEVISAGVFLKPRRMAVIERKLARANKPPSKETPWRKATWNDRVRIKTDADGKVIRRIPKYLKKKHGAKTYKKGALIKKLDLIISRITYLRWGGKCGICGREGTSKGHFSAHHFFSKKAHSIIRWEPANLIWLCYGCHFFRIHTQGDTEDARSAIIAKVGEKKFEEIKAISKQVHKYSIEDLLIMTDLLGAVLEDLKKSRETFIPPDWD